jgi:hypothetical protein
MRQGLFRRHGKLFVYSVCLDSNSLPLAAVVRPTAENIEIACESVQFGMVWYSSYG